MSYISKMLITWWDTRTFPVLGRAYGGVPSPKSQNLLAYAGLNGKACITHHGRNLVRGTASRVNNIAGVKDMPL